MDVRWLAAQPEGCADRKAAVTIKGQSAWIFVTDGFHRDEHRQGGEGEEARIRTAAAQSKKAQHDVLGFFTLRALAMTYFLTGNPQYHRRGVVSRTCSGWEGVGPTRYGRQEFWNEGMGDALHPSAVADDDAQGYRVKPHGQLVLVSSTHCCAYTPSLSTS